MTERKNNIVGILKFREMLTCIQALEKFEKEAQTIVEQTPDSELNEEWKKWQGLAVSARGALGAFRLIADRGRQINANPDTAYTIHWEGSLKKAMTAMGLEALEDEDEDDGALEEDDLS
jgi:CubicO group peptidase (beta-lactamase class C family)